MKTFEQFQASKRDVADLGIEFQDSSLAGVSGLVYADFCYIENRPDGQFYLLVGRGDWLSDDLAALERILYDQHYVYEAPDIKGG